MSDSTDLVKNAFYSRAIGGGGSEFDRNAYQFFLRLLQSQFTISPSGVFSFGSQVFAWSAIDKTGSSLADLTTRDASALSSGILPLARLSGIANAQIANSAAIAYSKLALAASIVNADIAVGAAIARSKLDFGSGLVDADIAAAAGILRSKLNFGSGLVNADIATAAAIALSKLAGWPADASGYLNNNGAGTLTWGSISIPAQQLALLKANSGTDTNAAAANVDTVAISGLTAKDCLIVLYSLETVTQATANPTLYNSTDSVTVSDITNATNLNTALPAVGLAIIQQNQSAATAIAAFNLGLNNGTSTLKQNGPTFSTAWTGSWTLALRHAGVTAGGTMKWTWKVFKLLGQ